MGGFLNVTGRTQRAASASEVACGEAVAALLPKKWVVVAKDPSGHRGAIGGSTVDFFIYQGGNTDGELGPDDLEAVENETLWGTIDAYTPEGSADTAAKTVRDKLSTQASKGVIVDLENFGNVTTRNTVINKIVAKVDEFGTKGMVIFNFRGENRFYHTTKPFPADSKSLTFK